MGDYHALKFDLDRKKKIFGQVQLSKLPDKGAKLKKDIDDLTQKIKVWEFESRKTENQDNEKHAKNSESADINVGGNNRSHTSKPSLPEKNPEGGSNDVKPKKISVKPLLKTDQCVKVFHAIDKPYESFSHNKNLSSYKSSSNEISKPVTSSKNYTSFEKLNQKSDYSANNTLPVNSPSFTTYRDNSVKPKTAKFTEAHSMDPYNSSIPKQRNEQLGSSHQTGMTFAKQKAVLNIHSCIASCPSTQDEEVDPVDLKTSLMKHQKRALTWLLWRETQDPKGGIFADDMGLGKTLNLISLILKEHERQPLELDRSLGGTLIICPASILHQWNHEVENHCKRGTLKVLVYHGSKREKSVNEMLHYDIVITTFNLILSEGKAYETKNKPSSLFKITWNRIILDEAHTIKNHKSQTASWIFKLKSDKKWAVTGTPIHNDLKDLYCLLKFLQCKPFDDYDVWKKLINDFSNHSVERRNTLVKSILLRRCKGDLDENGIPLISLPKKTFKHYRLKLSTEEQTIYTSIFQQSKEILADLSVKNRSLSKARTPHSLNQSVSKQSSGMYLTFLQKLQQCCCHLSLLKGPIEDEVSSVDLELEQLLDFSSLRIDDKEISNSSTPDLNLSYVKQDSKYNPSYSSSKVSMLISELDKILAQSEVEKCVIVSQWVSFLNIISLHLQIAGIEFDIIKGATKPEDRVTISENFNRNPKGPPILLLSLKAGGVGLNLVGGNHIFLMDFHWNPALEHQACDRIHRVGQNRDVFIHRFICVGTIEENIMKLQNEKTLLAGSVLDGAKHVRHNLTLDDIKVMFDFT